MASCTSCVSVDAPMEEGSLAVRLAGTVVPVRALSVWRAVRGAGAAAGVTAVAAAGVDVNVGVDLGVGVSVEVGAKVAGITDASGVMTGVMVELAELVPPPGSRAKRSVCSDLCACSYAHVVAEERSWEGCFA